MGIVFRHARPKLLSFLGTHSNSNCYHLPSPRPRAHSSWSARSCQRRGPTDRRKFEGSLSFESWSTPRSTANTAASEAAFAASSYYPGPLQCC